MIDNDTFTPAGVERRGLPAGDRRTTTTARRNEDMYGVADVDAIADDVTLRLAQEETSMALMLVAMISEAQEEIAQDPDHAVRALNRVKFVILRCCPMNAPDVAHGPDIAADQHPDHTA